MDNVNLMRQENIDLSSASDDDDDVGLDSDD